MAMIADVLNGYIMLRLINLDAWYFLLSEAL